MNDQDSDIKQIVAAHNALGKSVLSILKARTKTDINDSAFEELGRQLIEYSERLQSGIPRSAPFQLFKIAHNNADAT